jgi:hypothetical protein
VSRFLMDIVDARIHLGVEGSCGGTSFGLHLAANEILNKKRVLWVGESMPHPQRFSQLFSHVPLTESSRFHAMLFGVKFERTMNEILLACHSLPGLSLIVLDDWCSRQGHIEKGRIEQIRHLAEKIPSEIGMLCISKGGIQMKDGGVDEFDVRAKNKMIDMGYSTAVLMKSTDGYKRIFNHKGNEVILDINDEGYHFTGSM